MNRILFVGLCLVGIMVFAFSESNAKQKEAQKTKVVTKHTKAGYY
ncbi:hypothetical protein [Winogradskyella sp.]|nr:hypothetical protein [Winogradskyella sp.]